MKEAKQIRAVELLRCIRDRQAQLLEGKSDEEVIAFFKRAGVAGRKDVGRRRRTEPSAE